MKKYTTILAAAAFCIPFAAQAEGEKPAGDDAKKKDRKEMMIKKFDKDGDGKLSKEEKAAMQTERKAILAKYDTDKDGKLSKDERTGAMDTWKKEMNAKYDTNKDGELQAEEKKALRKAGEKPPFGAPGHGGKKKQNA